MMVRSSMDASLMALLARLAYRHLGRVRLLVVLRRAVEFAVPREPLFMEYTSNHGVKAHHKNQVYSSITKLGSSDSGVP